MPNALFENPIFKNTELKVIRRNQSQPKSLTPSNERQNSKDKLHSTGDVRYIDRNSLAKMATTTTKMATRTTNDVYAKSTLNQTYQGAAASSNATATAIVTATTATESITKYPSQFDTFTKYPNQRISVEENAALLRSRKSLNHIKKRRYKSNENLLETNTSPERRRGASLANIIGKDRINNTHSNNTRPPSVTSEYAITTEFYSPRMVRFDKVSKKTAKSCERSHGLDSPYSFYQHHHNSHKAHNASLNYSQDNLDLTSKSS